MAKAITIFLLAIFLFTSSILNSQTKKQLPCSSKEYQQFDFWGGNWNVYNTNNKLIGKNTVLKLPNACGIQENWESKTSNNLGTSYNYYNATDGTWNQLWIDNSGYSLNLKGSLKGNKMILKSKLVKSKKGNYYNQITWTKNTDKTVTQVWDLISEQNVKIKELFRGNYKKITK